jgi:haloacetate dehalogenase
MAQDQVEVMRHFGHSKFLIASHDRGARVAHRLCLDHPTSVRKVCFMDIIPTLTMYRDTSKEFATKYMWWFFLIQKEPLPEHMIGCDPEFFLDMHFEMQNGTPQAITPEMVPNRMIEVARVYSMEGLGAVDSVSADIIQKAPANRSVQRMRRDFALRGWKRL